MGTNTLGYLHQEHPRLELISPLNFSHFGGGKRLKPNQGKPVQCLSAVPAAATCEQGCAPQHAPAPILNHNTTNRLFIRCCLIKQYGSCLDIYNPTRSDLLEKASRF